MGNERRDHSQEKREREKSERERSKSSNPRTIDAIANTLANALANGSALSLYGASFSVGSCVGANV